MSNINYEYEHVFIHVPKTAGTSMERMSWVGGNSHASAQYLLAEAPCRFFTWGFVRHPLDRLVSAYHGLKENKGHRTPDVDTHDFNDWVMQLEPSNLNRYMQTVPMNSYLCDNRDNILVDFVGRYEFLAQDWSVVCSKVINKPDPLPHRNKSTHPHWTNVYSKCAEARARELYAKDFEIFDY